MTNFPGPYQVRLRYQAATTVGSRQHWGSVNLDMDTPADPGDPFVDWVCKSRLGATPTLKAFVDGLVAVVKERYPATESILYAELWQYTPGSNDAHFLSSYDINVVGTNVSSLVQDSQEIYTFRSTNGGSARFNLMDTVAVPGQFLGYAGVGPTIKAVFDYLTAQNSPALARDNGYLFNPLNWLPGVNEALFKDRFRS